MNHRPPVEWVPVVSVSYACPVHADAADCLAEMWYPGDHPERPLDLHGLFDINDCEACRRAWDVLGLPRTDLPVLASG